MVATQPSMNLPLAPHFSAVSDTNCGKENKRSVVSNYFILFLNTLKALL